MIKIVLITIGTVVLIPIASVEGAITGAILEPINVVRLVITIHKINTEMKKFDKEQLAREQKK